ncbi:hypothetical protein P43SY_005684 [Pythium insidiosum]|uniref:Reverse transcriptase Ty1/copia-type domain-containing protein n=1 Tax=Pythium insidiosum TaxID=114742 RepID=A0AAD5LY10_PYTIN|nr:hypothetical protein P43SY_005684 [Pythium insidiosum]
MHRTVMNMIRCLLFACGLPLHFWGDAAEYAVYILNRMPTRANSRRRSPIEVITGVRPSLIQVVVFGSPCTVFRDPKKKSLKERAQAGIIVGKNEETKGFKVYLPKDRVVVTTRHIANVETLPEDANEKLRRVLEAESEGELEDLAREREERRRHALEEEEKKAESGDEGASGAGASEQTEADKNKQKKSKKAKQDGDKKGWQWPTRRSTRRKRKSARRAEADGEAANFALSALNGVKPEYASLPDPKNYRESVRSPDAELWAKARKEELDALWVNETWTPLKRVGGKHYLHTKWVLKKKKNKDGEIERYKARLVACGNEQVAGVDYVLTFAAVLEMTSGKFILGMGIVWGVAARHFDVPSAYPRAMGEEGVEILLAIPDGMEFTADELRELGVSSVKELGLRVDKNLYGLRQAGRLWHQMLVTTLLDAGFTQSITDACVFFKVDEGGTTLVGAYVDDLLVTGTSNARVDAFFKTMSKLELKDLGVAENFLGMRIAYDKNGVCVIDQEKTIKELLERHGLEKANAVRMPIGEEGPVSEEDTAALPVTGPGTPERPTVRSFQSLVGSLLWVARCTRPDIAFAVHRASRRTHAPTVGDHKLAKRIARYLAGTTDVKMKMACDNPGSRKIRVETYSDADYAADKEDRKSVSGAMVMMNGMLIGWLCRKQTAVALSTAEAEFVAAALAGKEALGVLELARELELEVELPVLMHMDNQAAIKQVENEATSSQQKHVDVKVKFLRDYCSKKIVRPQFVQSKDMKADVLTKWMPGPRLLELREKIGMTSSEIQGRSVGSGNMVLHAVCGKESPRLACALGKKTQDICADQ